MARIFPKTLISQFSKSYLKDSMSSTITLTDEVKTIKWSELQKQADDFANGMMQQLDEFNKKYELENLTGAKPLVLARCPNCDFDLSKLILHMRFTENYIKFIQKHYVIVPDGTGKEVQEAGDGVSQG